MANFSEETVLAVWNKARKVDGADPMVWRKDYAGAWIKFDHRTCDDTYGWEIDHQKPVCKNGGDELSNLTPLHWENNRCKADNYPRWQTCLSSDGNKNVKRTQNWHVN